MGWEAPGAALESSALPGPCQGVCADCPGPEGKGVFGFRGFRFIVYVLVLEFEGVGFCGFGPFGLGFGVPGLLGSSMDLGCSAKSLFRLSPSSDDARGKALG